MSGFLSINASEARELVTKLAGPAFRGRKPGTPEFDAAARWAADRFRYYGLLPAGDNGTYFQRLKYRSIKIDATTARLEAGGEKFIFGKDFVFAATGDVSLRAKVAFVRLRDEPLTRSEKAKLRGRIVIVDAAGAKAQASLEDLKAAQEGGTLDAVSVTAPGNGLDHNSWFVSQPADEPESRGTVRALDLRPEAADRLAKAVRATRAARLETPDAEVFLEGRGVVESESISENVLAKLPGKTSEAVMVGAHLDHLGEWGDGRTYWGADDNASGSAATLLIARAFARSGAVPKRTIVFSLWTWEEVGEVGSRFYIQHPKIPLRDTVGYLNMDMVGRDSDGSPFVPRRPVDDVAEDNRDAIFLTAARNFSPQLYRLAIKANRAVGLNLRDDRDDEWSSTDIWPFSDAGIPVLGVFDGGHQDYHRATDTADKLNYPKMARVAQWVYLCAEDLANRRGRVAFSASGRYLTGLVRGGSDMPLPQGTEVEITLKENGRVIGTTRLVGTGHLPQRFALRYDAARLNAKKRYTVSARARLNGHITMASAEAPVLGQGWSAERFEVRLGPTQGG